MDRKTIIKALECCQKDDCDNCPNDFGNCYSNLAKDALALIKEQDEQIFALENRLKECENGYSQTLALERARLKELSEENKMLRLLRADDGLAVVDYAVDSIRAMKFNTARKIQEALLERIKGIYLDEAEVSYIIDEVVEKILNVKYGG